jgi:tRNA/rRNA methyltransferase
MTIIPFAPSFSPVFILVRPQLGENIGAAARVMKNFGFTDLRIVAPRDGWPNMAAQSMAAGGADILEKAQLYETTAAAAADIHQLFATTARPRDMQKPSISAHDFADFLRKRETRALPSDASPLKTAILFGPERTGLENNDIALADSIVYVPVNPDYPSLNLAQTVALMAYESSRLNADDYSQGHHPEHQNQGLRDTQRLATKAEINGFYDQLEQALDASNFWKVAEKKPAMWLNIRNLFMRARPTEQEVRTLRGLVRSLRER